MAEQVSRGITLPTIHRHSTESPEAYNVCFDVVFSQRDKKSGQTIGSWPLSHNLGKVKAIPDKSQPFVDAVTGSTRVLEVKDASTDQAES